MPLILNQKRYSSKYDDDPGVRYHYPEQYASYIQTGEVFIYYHPFEKTLDPGQYYFGMGRIGTVRHDPSHSDHYYAEILDYLPFRAAVPFKDSQGQYLEKKPGVGTRFFSSARRIGQQVFDRILAEAKLQQVSVDEFGAVDDPDNTDQILAYLNELYANLKPRAYERMVSQVDRPTSVSRALKKKLGYRCQICGVEGFHTRSGGRYAEAHHLRQLHELAPGSLATENVLIVCAGCHRKLHHASVRIEMTSEITLDVTINGATYQVKRNVF